MKQLRELRTKNRLSERIFRTLQSSEKAPDILRALSNGESIESIAESLGRPGTEEQEGVSPIGSPSSAVGGSEYELDAQVMSGFSWTTVTHDSATFDHLFPYQHSSAKATLSTRTSTRGRDTAHLRSSTPCAPLRAIITPNPKTAS
jgi:hypothetical protein